MPIISGRLVILLVYAAAVACSWSSNADISCTLPHSTPAFRSGNLLDQLSRVLNQLKAILDYQKWQPQFAFLQYTKPIEISFQLQKIRLPSSRRCRTHGRNFHRSGFAPDDNNPVRGRMSLYRRVPGPDFKTNAGETRDYHVQGLCHCESKTLLSHLLLAFRTQ